jgi:hypothetical protein
MNQQRAQFMLHRMDMAIMATLHKDITSVVENVSDLITGTYIKRQILLVFL